MRELPEPIQFEWDEGNKNKNFIKHSVTIREAEEIFINRPLYVSHDKYHSKIEERYQALGKTTNGRLLFAAFTIRYDKVRIISVRDMSKREERVYEKA